VSLLTGHALSCECALCQAGGKPGDKSFAASEPEGHARDRAAFERYNTPEPEPEPEPEKLPKPEKKPKK
jgi:hypothetical protein